MSGAVAYGTTQKVKEAEISSIAAPSFIFVPNPANNKQRKLIFGYERDGLFVRDRWEGGACSIRAPWGTCDWIGRVNYESDNSNASQYSIDKQGENLKPTELPRKLFGGVLLLVGLLSGICGNLACGYSGFRWRWQRRVLIGVGCWSIAVLLIIHGVGLVIDQPLASAPLPSDSHGAASPRTWLEKQRVWKCYAAHAPNFQVCQVYYYRNDYTATKSYTPLDA